MSLFTGSADGTPGKPRILMLGRTRLPAAAEALSAGEGKAILQTPHFPCQGKLRRLYHILEGMHE